MTPGPDPIEVRLGEVLRTREETVAVAESATGGLICSLLTDVPGASEYLDRGFVTYAYEAKTETLGVDRAALDEYGAVSEEVAAQMATGARDLAGTSWGLSLTGIAGPSGGTADKRVGTTYIGVAVAGEWGSGRSTVAVSKHEFEGDRVTVKRTAARQALRELLETIEQR